MLQVCVWNFTHQGIWDTQLPLQPGWSTLVLNLSSELSFPSLFSGPRTQLGVWVWENPGWTHPQPLTSTHTHSQYHLSWLEPVCLYQLWPGCYAHHKAKREPSQEWRSSWNSAFTKAASVFSSQAATLRSLMQWSYKPSFSASRGRINWFSFPQINQS